MRQRRWQRRGAREEEEEGEEEEQEEGEGGGEEPACENLVWDRAEIRRHLYERFHVGVSRGPRLQPQSQPQQSKGRKAGARAHRVSASVVDGYVDNGKHAVRPPVVLSDAQLSVRTVGTEERAKRGLLQVLRREEGDNDDNDDEEEEEEEEEEEGDEEVRKGVRGEKGGQERKRRGEDGERQRKRRRRNSSTVRDSRQGPRRRRGSADADAEVRVVEKETGGAVQEQGKGSSFGFGGGEGAGGGWNVLRSVFQYTLGWMWWQPPPSSASASSAASSSASTSTLSNTAPAARATATAVAAAAAAPGDRAGGDPSLCAGLASPSPFDEDAIAADAAARNEPTGTLALRRRVLQDLHERRLFVSDGLTFGADYLVYQDIPARCHAVAAIRILPHPSRWDSDIGRSWSSESISSYDRLQKVVDKKAVYAIVLPREDGNSDSGATPAATGADMSDTCVRYLRVNAQPSELWKLGNAYEPDAQSSDDDSEESSSFDEEGSVESDVSSASV